MIGTSENIYFLFNEIFKNVYYKIKFKENDLIYVESIKYIKEK